MTLVEMDRSTRDSRGADNAALRDWVRALEATAPIAGNPQRLLLDAIEELAQIQGDAEALISERGTPDLSRAGRAQPPLCALGARPKSREGSNGLPDDAEPAGLHGDLARHLSGRRRRIAHQHAIARPVARALHRHRRAVPRHRRRRMHRAVPLGATLHAGRKSGRMAAAIIRASIARSCGMRRRR